MFTWAWSQNCKAHSTLRSLSSPALASSLCPFPPLQYLGHPSLFHKYERIHRHTFMFLYISHQKWMYHIYRSVSWAFPLHSVPQGSLCICVGGPQCTEPGPWWPFLQSWIMPQWMTLCLSYFGFLPVYLQNIILLTSNLGEMPES